MVNLENVPWQITFDPDLTIDDARRYSLPGHEIPGSRPLILTDGMADLAKLLPAHIPGKSTAVVRAEFEASGRERIIIGIGVDWWFHGFINGEAFGDSGVDGNASHPVSTLDQLYVVETVPGKNVVTLHLRAGLGWDFGVSLFPVPEAWPADYRVMQKLVAKVLEKDFRLEREPVVFNLSCDRAQLAVEFSLPALCGVRFYPENEPGRIREDWSIRYGQREYRKIHSFMLNDLMPGSSYFYEVLLHDESAAEIKVAASGKFTTFPAAEAENSEHRFVVFGDVQFPTAPKRRILRQFAANNPLNEADFFVALGDMASGFGNFAMAYFDDFTEILRDENVLKPVAFVRGNHELWGEESLLYTRFLGCPYYAFTYGDTFYIALDSGEDQPRRMLPKDRTQKSDFARYYADEAAWLKEVVATPACRNAKKRIVLAHGTPFEFNDLYMAKNLAGMVSEVFYGENPLCKIDLWIAGHIHYALRYDPVAGTLTGVKPATRPTDLTENDQKNIHFPVCTNDGPNIAGADASILEVCCRKDDISVRYRLPEGDVLDEVIYRRGEKAEVVQTQFKLMWSR